MTEYPDNCPARITFSYKGEYERCPGGRKRRLNWEECERYADLMIQKKQRASRIQKIEASAMMTPGDVSEPSHLPTLNALWIIKHRKKEEEHFDQDPIISILEMIISLTIASFKVFHIFLFSYTTGQ